MKSLGAVGISLLLLFLIAGCDPMVEVTFVNETTDTLQFYEQTSAPSALAGHRPVSAGGTGGYDKIPADYAWMRVAATREDGQWVFDHTYTREELEKAKRRIVVSTLDPIAPPTGVTVAPYGGTAPPVLPSVKPSAAPASTLTPGRTAP